jgi:hypothetical protein
MARNCLLFPWFALADRGLALGMADSAGWIGRIELWEMSGDYMRMTIQAGQAGN